MISKPFSKRSEKTVSRPIDLSASRILTLHNSLRDSVADLAGCGAEIARELRSRRYSTEQAHVQQLEEFDAQTASAMEAINA